MVFMVIVLFFTSVYLSARFFLLSNNMREAKDNLKEISKDIERNRRLTLSSPNKDMENLLVEINNYLEITQMEKIKNVRREQELRKEIENISHDLRTPLTSILGYIDLMKDEEIGNEEKYEYISIVEKKSRALKNLIQDFYDLSRLETDEYKIEIKNIDIHKELMEQLLIFYNDFDKKNIDVELNLGDKEIIIQGDLKIIERIFINLIQNAAKYTKDTFKVCIKESKDNVDIIFSNNVENLEKISVEKLFNRFYMKDESRNNQSSGLGLTITKLLVEKINGSIKAEINDNFIHFIITFKHDYIKCIN
ncbi:sensor histidine kinase [Terrisporobacter petrolearius]|uniref:sensor histidine kinase n=1 Tax=Terrisporobacter petrolearius TaxID=1460447 RepID=UPI0022DF6D15|nr:HAMP domain-containing sensor histidine kinase [Terrisporobacter petrolearius]